MILNGTLVSFCTNTMNDRGKVFHCQAQNGRAIVLTAESWDCMRFAEINYRIGDDLGKIAKERIPGTTELRWVVKNDKGFTILNQGNG